MPPEFGMSPACPCFWNAHKWQNRQQHYENKRKYIDNYEQAKRSCETKPPTRWMTPTSNVGSSSNKATKNRLQRVPTIGSQDPSTQHPAASCSSPWHSQQTGMQLASHSPLQRFCALLETLLAPFTCSGAGGGSKGTPACCNNYDQVAEEGYEILGGSSWAIAACTGATGLASRAPWCVTLRELPGEQCERGHRAGQYSAARGIWFTMDNKRAVSCRSHKPLKHAKIKLPLVLSLFQNNSLPIRYG